MTAQVGARLLTECLDDVLAGRRTIEECLAAHPAEADELRPLLVIAVQANPPPPADLDPTFPGRGRQAILAVLAHEKVHATPSPIKRWWDAFGAGFLSLGPRAMAGRPAVVAAGLLLVLIGTLSAAAYAARDSVPGDPLYPLKIAGEELDFAFAIGDEAKVAAAAEAAQERLKEIQISIGSGRVGAAESAARGYVRSVDRAIHRLASAATLRGKFADQLAHDLLRLDALQAQAPEPARSAIGEASRAANRGLTVALALGQQSSEASMEPLSISELSTEPDSWSPGEPATSLPEPQSTSESGEAPTADPPMPQPQPESTSEPPSTPILDQPMPPPQPESTSEPPSTPIPDQPMPPPESAPAGSPSDDPTREGSPPDAAQEPTPVPASSRTVKVCHATGSRTNPYVFQEIEASAVESHRAHGDIIGVGSPADCPPATPGASQGRGH